MLSREAQALDYLRSIVPGAVTTEVETALKDIGTINIRRADDQIHLGSVALSDNPTEAEFVVNSNGLGTSGGELYESVGLIT